MTSRRAHAQAADAVYASLAALRNHRPSARERERQAEAMRPSAPEAFAKHLAAFERRQAERAADAAKRIEARRTTLRSIALAFSHLSPALCIAVFLIVLGGK